MIRVIERTKIKQYNSSRVALIIRHAERNDIPAGEFGNEVKLTEKGCLASIDFGVELSDLKIHKIYTSSLIRCVETAQNIIKGYEHSVPIETDTALGNPGLHIYDSEIAGGLFLKNGVAGIYKAFCNNIQMPGILTPDEFARQFTDFILSRTVENGVTLFVTHDIVIAFLEYCVNAKIYHENEWVGFLSGLTLLVE
jgi:broad specificity phosphatase PhoE